MRVQFDQSIRMYYVHYYLYHEGGVGYGLYTMRPYPVSPFAPTLPLDKLVQYSASLKSLITNL